MKLKLPTREEIRKKIPDKEELEDLFFRGYHIKRKIELMEEYIIQREKRNKELSKFKVMKKFRTNELLVRAAQGHIRMDEKRFRKLFDLK